MNITAIPENLADKMGMPLLAGQLLCSAILLLIFIMPTALIARKKGNAWVAELIMGLVVMGVCIALTWLPYWFILVICLIVAAMYANKAKGALGGKNE